jgi:hypothetical protein
MHESQTSIHMQNCENAYITLYTLQHPLIENRNPLSVVRHLFSSKPYQQTNSFSFSSHPTPLHTPKTRSHLSSLPPTQPGPRISSRRPTATTLLLLLLLAPSGITGISARPTRIVPTLHHRAIILTRRWAGRWRRGVPAWREMLLLLLLAVAMLRGRRLLGAVAAPLLARWRRKVLLVGRRGDGAVGRWVVA